MKKVVYWDLSEKDFEDGGFLNGFKETESAVLYDDCLDVLALYEGEEFVMLGGGYIGGLKYYKYKDFYETEIRYIVEKEYLPVDEETEA